jgi:hypothetical protein
VPIALATDTVSITIMEAIENATMLVFPGAMDAGLDSLTFWGPMALGFAIAFPFAFAANRYLLARGKGHALTHARHGTNAPVTGARRFIPDLPAPALAGAIAAFMLGGLVVAIADGLA